MLTTHVKHTPVGTPIHRLFNYQRNVSNLKHPQGKFVLCLWFQYLVSSYSIPTYGLASQKHVVHIISACVTLKQLPIHPNEDIEKISIMQLKNKYTLYFDSLLYWIQSKTFKVEPEEKKIINKNLENVQHLRCICVDSWKYHKNACELHRRNIHCKLKIDDHHLTLMGKFPTIDSHMRYISEWYEKQYCHIIWDDSICAIFMSYVPCKGR